MSDAEGLAQLLQLIRGELGPHWRQRGLHSYPDIQGGILHDACLELERQGLIYRKDEGDDGWVFWWPVEEGAEL